MVTLPVTPPLIFVQWGEEVPHCPIPNAVNMLVANDHVFVPRQACAPFEAKVKEILKDQVGLGSAQIHFVDDREPHFAGGEVHCGSDVKRAVPDDPGNE